MSKSINAFEHIRAAWYGDHALEEEVFDEVRFGKYPQNGGPAITVITLRWQEGKTFGGATLSVESADWPLLYQYREVLQELASVSNRPVTPGDVIEILKGHEFVDVTEVVDFAPLFDLMEAN